MFKFPFFIFHMEWTLHNWTPIAVGMKPNRDIYVFQAVRMSSNYWSDCMKIEMATIIKRYIFAIASVRPKLFSLISDFWDNFDSIWFWCLSRNRSNSFWFFHCVRRKTELSRQASELLLDRNSYRRIFEILEHCISFF